MNLPTGKLAPEMLARLLASIPKNDSRVMVWPGIGLDAAVIALEGEYCLVAKTDPISFATDAIGWYAVQVCANDVATMAATPRWFMATVLLPTAGDNAALAETIFSQLNQACAALGVSLVGGHTEITYGLDRPIVCGTLLGEVRCDQVIMASGARPGDAIILTKGIAVEGTSIIAREKADLLRAHVDPAFLARCQAFLVEPGISVVKDASIAVRAGRVHAMHDPTEGGLSNGLWEMAHASGVGLHIEADAVPIYSETLKLCRLTGLQPWGLIASGALLLAVEALDAQDIVGALQAHHVHAAVIGHAVEDADNVTLRYADKCEPLPRFERDEIARLFA